MITRREFMPAVAAMASAITLPPRREIPQNRVVQTIECCNLDASSIGGLGIRPGLNVLYALEEWLILREHNPRLTPTIRATWRFEADDLRKRVSDMQTVVMAWRKPGHGPHIGINSICDLFCPRAEIGCIYERKDWRDRSHWGPKRSLRSERESIQWVFNLMRKGRYLNASSIPLLNI